MKPTLKTAAVAHFEAKRQEAYANLQIYLNNAVGVAEHPNFLAEVVGLTKQLAEAEECLQTFMINFADGEDR